MTFSPVHSPYPGKYVMATIAALIVVHLSYVIALSMRSSKKLREQQSQGIFEKPDPKKNPTAGIGIALFDLFLLLSAGFAIYKSWPN
jgi:hypothetical protein